VSRFLLVVRGSRFTLLLPLHLAFGAFTVDAVPPRASGISVSIDIARTDATTGRFLCTAEVTDLASGEVIAAPKVAFLAGSSGQAKTGFQPDAKKPPSVVALEVSAAKAGDSASFTVSYTREGVLVAVQKGSLSLR